MNLVQCLLATLSPDGQIRQQSTSYLEKCSKQEGFSLKLIAVVQSNDPAAATVRQLAGVVLRRHIQKHWASEDLENGAAQISELEKAQVRAILPASLAEPNSLIQTAVGMAIAEIGKSDCPHAWPELLPGLVHAVSDKTNPHVVFGAVRCLALLVEDISEEQVVEMAPVVLPELLHIVQNEAHPAALRRWALIIFKTCLGALELTYKQSPTAAAILQAALGPWLQAIAGILDAPLSGDDAALWGIKFEALGCIVRIIRSFSKLAAGFLPPILSSCWSMFTNCAPVYDQLVVRGEGDDSGIEDDSSLERVSFSDLISQLFELLLTLPGNPRMLPMLRPAFPQLAYFCVGYMQASDDNVEKWNADINEYLSNEDDFWSTRASGELLLDEMLESGGTDGMAAVGEAIQRRTSEAEAAKQSGDQHWWRLKEAALLAAGGAVAERCVQLKKKKKAIPASIDPEVAGAAVLSEILIPGGSGAPAFVVGRALWLFYKWAPALSPSLRSAALRVACPALGPSNPPLVQAGACQAVSRLCKGATPEDIQAVSEQAFVGLASLLPSAEEDSLHLVVGTLTSLVKVDPAGAARWAGHLIPGALKVWLDNVADPLVGEDAEDLLRMVASTPGCLPSLQNLAVPTLCEVVSNSGAHSPILAAGCLDMLTLVLQPSTPDAAAAVANVALLPVLRVLSTTDDEEVASAAVAFLRTTLQVGGTDALGWAGQEPAVGAAGLIQAAQHLLKLETPDVACRNVGGLILELLRHAAPQITPQLGDILVAIARKLRIVEDPMAVQSLLSVLAFVARSDATQLVDLLSKADGGANDGASALQVAMLKWTERHMEIRTPYDIKSSITALGSLLACPHPALNAVVVKGKRVDTGTGIRTRARGVTQAEQWSQVPLRVKLVMLLADSFIEATTQGEGGEHGMGQWGGEDEYDFDDDDDDDSDGEEGSIDEDRRSNAGQWDGKLEFDLKFVFRGLLKLEYSIVVQHRGFVGCLILSLIFYCAEYGMLISAFGDDDDGGFFEEQLANVDPLENARRLADPLSGMDVGVYVAGAFKELAQSSQDLMQAAAAELTATQVAAVERIWQA